MYMKNNSIKKVIFISLFLFRKIFIKNEKKSKKVLTKSMGDVNIREPDFERGKHLGKKEKKS